MAMSVGSDGGEEKPMSDINTTPLVDVMLVLLIIFLITIPVALDKVKVSVPNRAYQPTITKAENVLLSVKGEADGTCGVYWGLSRVSAAKLLDLGYKKFKNEVDRLGDQATNPDLLPEVHVRADRSTPYRCIGGVVAVMQNVGFMRVGFISEPVNGGGA